MLHWTINLAVITLLVVFWTGNQTFPKKAIIWLAFATSMAMLDWIFIPQTRYTGWWLLLGLYVLFAAERVLRRLIDSHYPPDLLDQPDTIRQACHRIADSRGLRVHEAWIRIKRESQTFDGNITETVYQMLRHDALKEMSSR